jgi:hypothetical protein
LGQERAIADRKKLKNIDEGGRSTPVAITESPSQ